MKMNEQEKYYLFFPEQIKGSASIRKSFSRVKSNLWIKFLPLWREKIYLVTLEFGG
jgi:hypothetical protein